MTLDEARLLLEVDAHTSGKELHRAYLRAVKSCPPDQDPVGFQRVRSAYELLKAAPEAGVVLRSSHRPPSAETPRSPYEAALERAEAAESPADWQLVERLFAAASSAGDSGRGAPAPLAIEMVGALVVSGDVAAATQLSEVFEAWIAVVGEARALPGALAVRWPLIRDVRLVAEHLPAPLGAQLARYVLRNEVPRAGQLLERASRVYPVAAKAAAKRLSNSTSLFAETFRPAFSPVLPQVSQRPPAANVRSMSPPPAPTHVSSPSGSQSTVSTTLIIVVLVVLANVVRLFLQTAGHH